MFEGVCGVTSRVRQLVQWQGIYMRNLNALFEGRWEIATRGRIFQESASQRENDPLGRLDLDAPRLNAERFGTLRYGVFSNLRSGHDPFDGQRIYGYSCQIGSLRCQEKLKHCDGLRSAFLSL